MYSSCNLFREFGKGKQVDQWLKLFIRYNLSEQKYIRSINFFFHLAKISLTIFYITEILYNRSSQTLF